MLLSGLPITRLTSVSVGQTTRPTSRWLAITY